LDGKIVIVHGHDCDSICSAVIFLRLVKKLSKVEVKNIVTELNYGFGENDLRAVKKLSAKYVVILDIPEIGVEYLTELTKMSKVLIVDHHKPKGYVRVSYVNPLVYENVYMPTTYLSYKIFESFYKPDEVLWIACIGTLGDHGVESCGEIFKKLKKIHPELLKGADMSSESIFNSSELGVLTRMVDAARVVDVKHVSKAVELLTSAKSYKEVKNDKWFKKLYESVEKEFERIKKDFEKNKKVFGRAVFYEIKSKYNLKSSFAGYVASLFEDKILCVVQRFGEFYEVSFRKGVKVPTDLSEFVPKIVDGIGYGGGHPAAAAAKFPEKSLKVFINRLKTVS
jgi:single-stranded DNA-specific DHH superfamily exonuclease